jgi:hypothetical protein
MGKMNSLKTRSNIMKRTALKHTIFLAGMMIASLTFATPEVNKCMDADGNVTLTDAPCRADQQVAVELNPREPEATEVVLASNAYEVDDTPAMAPMRQVTRVYAASVESQRLAAKLRNQAPRPKMGLDVAMLKVAKMRLQMADRAGSASRQMQLASN